MAATAQDLKIFRYPYKKLDKSEDYLKIECLEYIPPDVSINLTTFIQPSSDGLYDSLSKKDIRGTIILPIPDGLPQNGNSVSWGESTMGPLQTLGVGVAMGTIKGGMVEGLKSLATATKTGIDALSQTGRGQKLAQGFFATKAVEQLLGQQGDLFGTLLGRTTGAVFNENVELLFKGLTLRPEFTFNFDITPRFKEEAEQVRQMIVFLKQEMAAKKGNTRGAAAGLFLTAPSVFRIQYMSGGNPHPYLNTFKICALNNLQLNFTGSNTYATYSDGTPVHMQLGLSFRELTPIYNEDYKQVTGTGY